MGVLYTDEHFSDRSADSAGGFAMTTGTARQVTSNERVSDARLAELVSHYRNVDEQHNGWWIALYWCLRELQERRATVETREQPLVLNGHQLRQALEFLDNENDTDLCFRLYTEDRLEPGKHGGPMPKGMYCWFFEYPEEGQLLLSDRPTAQKASALPESLRDPVKVLNRGRELLATHEAVTRSAMYEFLGWLSGDIPELHAVEVPRLADSWERYRAKIDEMPAENGTADSGKP
jgi:hypothetical protein